MNGPRFVRPATRGQLPFAPPPSSSQFDAARRDRLNSIGEFEKRLTRAGGAVLVQGTGQATLSISFPAPFVEKPDVVITYERTSAPDDANLPTFSGSVLGWTTTDDPNGDPLTWTGADIGAVISGDDAQVGYINWTAIGRVVLSSGL